MVLCEYHVIAGLIPYVIMLSTTVRTVKHKIAGLKTIPDCMILPARARGETNCNCALSINSVSRLSFH